MNEAFQFLNDHIRDKAKLRPGATEAEIQQLVDAAPFLLPDEYLDCLRACNGMEEFVGEGYLVFWSVDETMEHHAFTMQGDYLSDFRPHLLIIGGEGANAVFAIDGRNAKVAYVEIDQIGSSDWNDVFYQCETLVEMFKWFAFGRWIEPAPMMDEAERKAWDEVLSALTKEESDDFGVYRYLIQERDAGRYEAEDGSCGDARLDALAERVYAQVQATMERIWKERDG